MKHKIYSGRGYIIRFYDPHTETSLFRSSGYGRPLCNSANIKSALIYPSYKNALNALVDLSQKIKHKKGFLYISKVFYSSTKILSIVGTPTSFCRSIRLTKPDRYDFLEKI